MTVASSHCLFCQPGSPCALHTPPQPGDKPAPEVLLEVIKSTYCEKCGSPDCPVSGIPVCRGCFGYFPEIPHNETDQQRLARADFARGVSDEWHNQPYANADASNLSYQLGRQRVVNVRAYRERDAARATSGV